MILLLTLPASAFAEKRLDSTDRVFIEEVALKVLLIRLSRPPQKINTDLISIDTEPASEIVAMQSFMDAIAFARERKKLRENFNDL